METRSILLILPTTLFAIFFLLSHIAITSAFSDVVEACKSITVENENDEEAGPTYGFCVTSLQVVYGASTADLASMAFLSANLTIANATSTERVIKDLSQKETRSLVRGAFQTCMDSYDEIVQNARTAADEIVQKKDYVTANKIVTAAMAAVDNCKDGFDDSSVKSPILKENKDMHALLGILIRFIVKIQESV